MADYIDRQKLIDDFHTAGSLFVYGDYIPAIVSRIKMQPAIEPETMPVVQELQAQVKEQKEQLAHLEYWELDRKQVLKSAACDRAAVKAMQKHCEKTIAELRAELKRVTEERDAAVKELEEVTKSVDDLAEFVDSEIHPSVDYGLYLALRENVDAVAMFQHESEWR